jgi:hypothetical protein
VIVNTHLTPLSHLRKSRTSENQIYPGISAVSFFFFEFRRSQRNTKLARVVNRLKAFSIPSTLLNRTLFPVTTYSKARRICASNEASESSAKTAAPFHLLTLTGDADASSSDLK